MFCLMIVGGWSPLSIRFSKPYCQWEMTSKLSPDIIDSILENPTHMVGAKQAIPWSPVSQLPAKVDHLITHYSISLSIQYYYCIKAGAFEFIEVGICDSVGLVVGAVVGKSEGALLGCIDTEGTVEGNPEGEFDGVVLGELDAEG